MQERIKSLLPKARCCMSVLCLAVMLVVPVAYKCLLKDEPVSLMRFVSSMLYCLPLCFLIHAIRRRWIYAIICTLIMVMSFMESLMVALYGNYLVVGNILAVMTTTAEEGGGFIVGTIHALPWGIPVLLAWCGALFLHKKDYKAKYDMIGFVLFALLSCAFLAFQLAVTWKGNITTRFYVEQNVLARPPYNFCFQLANASEQIRNRSFIDDAKNMSFGASRPAYEGRESYVLFVGESLRYASLSLGEYERSTTPLLESLDNVTLFSNYYSTANLTMYSVPQILTRATPEDFVLNYKEKSIFKPFQECGFKTFVICAGNLLSQEKYLSDGCDSLYTLKDGEDDKIAAIVDSLTNVCPKTFFIVQEKGNHGPYVNFTKEQDKYHPNPVSDKVPWDNHKAMVNAYDNTVLFTDFVAHSIIKAIDKPDMQSAFILVSDHGADYDTGVSDHGGNCNPRINEYHVPLIFWGSSTWCDKHSNKHKNVMKNKDLPVNADNIFYSMCDVADITICKQYANPQWSIFADKLQLHERKLLVPDGKNYIVVK